MWWKLQEGIKSDADFQKFRQTVLKAPVSVNYKDDVIEAIVKTPSGNLGVKADLNNKKAGILQSGAFA